MDKTSQQDLPVVASTSASALASTSTSASTSASSVPSTSTIPTTVSSNASVEAISNLDDDLQPPALATSPAPLIPSQPIHSMHQQQHQQHHHHQQQQLGQHQMSGQNFQQVTGNGQQQQQQPQFSQYQSAAQHYRPGGNVNSNMVFSAPNMPVYMGPEVNRTLDGISQQNANIAMAGLPTGYNTTSGYGNGGVVANHSNNNMMNNIGRAEITVTDLDTFDANKLYEIQSEPVYQEVVQDKKAIMEIDFLDEFVQNSIFENDRFLIRNSNVLILVLYKHYLRVYQTYIEKYRSLPSYIYVLLYMTAHYSDDDINRFLAGTSFNDLQLVSGETLKNRITFNRTTVNNTTTTLEDLRKRLEKARQDRVKEDERRAELEERRQVIRELLVERDALTEDERRKFEEELDMISAPPEGSIRRSYVFPVTVPPRKKGLPHPFYHTETYKKKRNMFRIMSYLDRYVPLDFACLSMTINFGNVKRYVGAHYHTHKGLVLKFEKPVVTELTIRELDKYPLHYSKHGDVLFRIISKCINDIQPIRSGFIGIGVQKDKNFNCLSSVGAREVPMSQIRHETRMMYLAFNNLNLYKVQQSGTEFFETRTFPENFGAIPFISNLNKSVEELTPVLSKEEYDEYRYKIIEHYYHNSLPDRDGNIPEALDINYLPTYEQYLSINSKRLSLSSDRGERKRKNNRRLVAGRRNGGGDDDNALYDEMNNSDDDDDDDDAPAINDPQAQLDRNRKNKKMKSIE